jgi:hypothetical protein
MKLKMFLAGVVVFVVLVIPVYSGGSTILETTGWITESPQGLVFDFWLEPASSCTATISDLSYEEHGFGFQDLFMSISTAKEKFGATDEAGTIQFTTGEKGNTYFANIFGLPVEGGRGAGNFGLHIEAVHASLPTSQVPIPGSLVLLGSGLMGVVGLRKKFRKWA